MPKFALLIYEDEDAGPKPPSAEWLALWNAYVALDEEAKACGVLVDSQPFAHSSEAVTVALRGGQLNEMPGVAERATTQLTGYYLLSCESQAEAIRWAAKIPAAATGRVEVRRVIDGPDEP